MPNLKTRAEPVLDQLIELDQSLPGNSPVRPFNTAYIVITANLIKNLGSFANRQLVEQEIQTFARYYFEALSRPDPPGAWGCLFEKRRGRLTDLTLGVNAHINHDLPLALAESDPLTEEDYHRIGEIIDQSVQEVIRKVYPNAPIRRWMVLLATPLISRLIKSWRHQAWQSYQALKSDHLTESELDRRTTSKAKKIQKSFLK